MDRININKSMCSTAFVFFIAFAAANYYADGYISVSDRPNFGVHSNIREVDAELLWTSTSFDRNTIILDGVPSEGGNKKIAREKLLQQLQIAFSEIAEIVDCSVHAITLLDSAGRKDILNVQIHFATITCAKTFYAKGGAIIQRIGGSTGKIYPLCRDWACLTHDAYNQPT